MPDTTRNARITGGGKLDDAPLPPVVDRATYQAQLDELLLREKAHTREGDAIAAARRRLPMVEVDAKAILVGEDGPVTLLDVFEGRRQLVVYYHMWHEGQPAAGQCEGCTFFTSHMRELSYLHSRDVTYATFCEGSYEESARYRAFMGWDVPWYSAKGASALGVDEMGFGRIGCYLRDGDRVFETYWTTGRATERLANSYAVLDMTVYGRQEVWEDSPAGWPQPLATSGEQFRLNGRPTSQWPRLAAGRSEDLDSASTN